MLSGSEGGTEEKKVKKNEDKKNTFPCVDFMDVIMGDIPHKDLSMQYDVFTRRTP